MNVEEIKEIIRRALPSIIMDDIETRDSIFKVAHNLFAGKTETDNRFDRILDEMRADREEQAKKWEEQYRKWEEQNRKWDEQNRKWDEQNRKQNRKWDEQNRKWDEQNRKWDEQNRKWDENQELLRKMNARIESGIGALGARWGIFTEESFRNGLQAILEDSFGVEVLNVTEFDEEGVVFGRPDQVELDVIVKNGTLIICEIKSSMSRGDIYIFDRKASFYEKLHDRKADRRIVVSPNVDPRGMAVAEKLGIEVYTRSDDVKI